MRNALPACRSPLYVGSDCIHVLPPLRQFDVIKGDDMSAQPAPFRLYSTLSKTVEDFTPLTPGEVKLYVCGMTV